MKSVISPLAKINLLPFGLLAATYAAIKKKTHGSGTKTLIISNEEMEDIMKIVKSLEITSQEGGFLNFLRPLMTARLPSTKSVISTLAKISLLPFGLSTATYTAIKKNLMDQALKH